MIVPIPLSGEPSLLGELPVSYRTTRTLPTRQQPKRDYVRMPRNTVPIPVPRLSGDAYSGRVKHPWLVSADKRGVLTTARAAVVRWFRRVCAKQVAGGHAVCLPWPQGGCASEARGRVRAQWQ